MSFGRRKEWRKEMRKREKVVRKIMAARKRHEGRGDIEQLRHLCSTGQVNFVNRENAAVRRIERIQKEESVWRKGLLQAWRKFRLFLGRLS